MPLLKTDENRIGGRHGGRLFTEHARLRAVASRLVLCACLALAFSGCGRSTAIAPVDGRSLAPLKRPDFERLLVAQLKEAGAPGAVALVRTPKGTWRGAVGFSNLRTKTMMRPGDRFWVGSVTKTFVATLVLDLVGDRRLRLDDTVERWLPGLLPQGREITIRELLNHTSGLANYFDDPSFRARVSRDPEFVVSPRELIELASSRPLEFRPRTDWSYSNTNYLVLGLIVEKATGKGIAEELTRRIFQPLGLRRTAFESPGHRRLASRMRGYDLSGSSPRDVTPATLGGPWSDGAIASDTDDLARFFGALLGGKLLSDDLLQAMQETVSADGAAAGLGIFRQPLTCGQAWGHGGGTPGYLTSVLASRDGTRLVIVATNGAGDGAVAEGLRVASQDAYCRS